MMCKCAVCVCPTCEKKDSCTNCGNCSNYANVAYECDNWSNPSYLQALEDSLVERGLKG